jgi:nucleoid-associated protein YgaU
MGKSGWILGGVLLLPAAGWAQSAEPPVSALDVANLREDVRGLTQKVADLALQVEQLEAENAALRAKLGGTREAVSPAQLRDAEAELRATFQSGLAAAQADTLRQVSALLDKLPHDAGGAPARAEAAAGTGFRTDFPKEGVTYVVQKGDTLALIAKKTGAKFQDIVNANRLADPSHIRIGQTLFIPEAKN